MVLLMIDSPLIVMSPDSILRSPVIAWTSSVCPFPSIPAIPIISPARTSNDKFLTAGMPRFSLTTKFLIERTTSLGFEGIFSVLKET